VSYIPAHERAKIERVVRRKARELMALGGEMPYALTVPLPLDDNGEKQEPIDFLLVPDGAGGLAYESVRPVEMAGVPGAMFRIPLRRRRRRPS
jgi:hypothetical protein